MKTNCDNCPYGPYSSLSDWCDECMEDSDTGWFGFYDHRVGKHFNSREEQEMYYREHEDDEDYDDLE